MPKGSRAMGGRYTRPRRGFRARSHYRNRLKERGLTRQDVKMEPLYVLRKRQSKLPRRDDSSGRAGRAHSTLRAGHAGLPVFDLVSDVAPYDIPGEWEDFI